MKVFRIKGSEGTDLWEKATFPAERPEGCPETYIQVDRVGAGNFQTWLNPDILEEIDFPKGLEKGFAAITDYEDFPFFPCLCNPYNKWNGWSQPYFTKEIFDKVCKEFNMKEFSRKPNEDRPDIWNVCYYFNDDKPASDECWEELTTGNIYPDGTYDLDGWCWSFFTKEEKEDWEKKREEEHADVY